MNMKFNMGSDVLTNLTTQTSTANQDLGGLVRQLATSAEPLEGRFQGAAKATFDSFKLNVDAIATELDAALAAVLTGINAQNVAFIEGEQQMGDELRSAESSVSYDAASFSRSGS